MSLSQGEYLRRKMEAAPKRIAPRPLGDSSMVTQSVRVRALANSVGRYNDGQAQVYSSEWLASARAGCAVCNEPEQKVKEVACCPYGPDSDHSPLAQAYWGSTRGCCGPLETSKSAAKVCCPDRVGERVTTNTLWTNRIGVGSVGFGPAPPCRPNAPCGEAVEHCGC